MNDKQCITFTVDGKEVSQAEIRAVEMKRCEKVLNELVAKSVLQPAQIENLSLDAAKLLIAQTKKSLGSEGMLRLYEQEIKASDDMWHDIAAASPTRSELQAGIVDVKARGISLFQFMTENAEVVKENSLFTPSLIHPEHYSFEIRNGEQVIVETFGMYGNPTYMRLISANDGFTPIPLDEDTDFAMVGYTHLAHDDADTKIIGMHQFKEREDGLEVKLGVFLPKAAPAEMLEGHKWHLMVEFNNCLSLAAEKQVSPLRKLALKAALRKMKKAKS